jgi:hypothetical protein
LRNKEVDIAIYKLTDVDIVFRDEKVIGSLARKLIYQSDHQLFINELINNTHLHLLWNRGDGSVFSPSR